MWKILLAFVCLGVARSIAAPHGAEFLVQVAASTLSSLAWFAFVVCVIEALEEIKRS